MFKTKVSSRNDEMTLPKIFFLPKFNNFFSSSLGTWRLAICKWQWFTKNFSTFIKLLSEFYKVLTLLQRWQTIFLVFLGKQNLDFLCDKNFKSRRCQSFHRDFCTTFRRNSYSESKNFSLPTYAAASQKLMLIRVDFNLCAYVTNS